MWKIATAEENLRDNFMCTNYGTQINWGRVQIMIASLSIPINCESVVCFLSNFNQISLSLITE